MSFPTPDQLNTLADAREAFRSALAAHQNSRNEVDALRDDLQTANEMLDEAAKEKTSLTAKLETASDAHAQLKTSFSAKDGQIKALEERIGKLETEAKSAEAKAAEICASVGVEPVEAKPESEAKQASLMEQFRAITDPAKQTAFFRKHREALLG